MQAQVQSLEFRGQSVVILNLLPENTAFHYREGQYLSIALPGTDQHRSYSMASPCRPDGAIELHIRLHEHGAFSHMLRERIEIGSTLTLSGPYGDCIWSVPADACAKVILLATGTGIAPLKAMIERHARSAPRNAVWLYWGGDRPEDFYVAQALRALEQECAHFHFVPVLREGAPDWAGARGFVQDIAAADHPDLGDAYVFACGSPIMVRMARERLMTTCGLPEDRFFFDAFEPSEPHADAAARASDAPVTLSVQLPNGARHAVRCRAGEPLMRSLVAEHFVQAICGGNQSCGTCRVTFDEADLARLPVMSRAERRLLAALPASGPCDRLSCQLNADARYEGLQLRIPPQDF
ncbi:FAD-binding oxidoreductase [Burkholderia sp. 22PA0099]|uniref:FAD-binding oxidoreductase n=1 Tax=Burkholderia sp. 22PA0099 TaxID=3237372 RepID=UPI0039C07E92